MLLAMWTRLQPRLSMSSSTLERKQDMQRSLASRMPATGRKTLPRTPRRASRRRRRRLVKRSRTQPANKRLRSQGGFRRDQRSVPNFIQVCDRMISHIGGSRFPTLSPGKRRKDGARNRHWNERPEAWSQVIRVEEACSCELPGLLRPHSVDACLDIAASYRSCCHRSSAEPHTTQGGRTVLYPNRRDVLMALGALAAGTAFGESAPYLQGTTASTTSQTNAE